MRLLRWLFATSPQAPLGRWCHPKSSPLCNQDIKAHLANIDNSSFPQSFRLGEEKDKPHCSLPSRTRRDKLQSWVADFDQP